MTDRASIDDLLGYDDGPAEPPRGAATVAKALLVGVVATAAVAGAARLGGVAVPLPLIAFGVAALIALRFAVRWVAPPPATSARALVGGYEPDAGTYQWPTPDAMRRAVTRWEQRLTWHGDTPGTFGAQLQPALRELADERLRLRDGGTLAGDPEHARAVLGEPAWSVLTGQWRRGPGRQELSQAVARLEELS